MLAGALCNSVPSQYLRTLTQQPAAALQEHVRHAGHVTAPPDFNNIRLFLKLPNLKLHNRAGSVLEFLIFQPVRPPPLQPQYRDLPGEAI